MVSKTPVIEILYNGESVCFHSRQEWIRGAIEHLDWRQIGLEESVVHQTFDGILIAHELMRLLHLKIPKEMPHAVGAIEWAADYVI